MLVRSSVPLIVPLVGSVAFVTVRSATTGPRTPRTDPLCICATVAGDRSPSNDPVIVSLLPASTADTVPDPATVACIAKSIGTVDSRPLYVFGDCAVTRTRLVAARAMVVSHWERRMRAAPEIGRGHHNASGCVRGVEVTPYVSGSSADPGRTPRPPSGASVAPHALCSMPSYDESPS